MLMNEVDSEKILALINYQVSILGGGVSDNCIVSLNRTLKRIEENFSKRNSALYEADGKVKFDTLHSVQYSIFLCTFANQLYKDGYEREATYIYYLNKIMHSVDWFYAVEFPVHWGGSIH